MNNNIEQLRSALSTLSGFLSTSTTESTDVLTKRLFERLNCLPDHVDYADGKVPERDIQFTAPQMDDTPVDDLIKLAQSHSDEILEDQHQPNTLAFKPLQRNVRNFELQDLAPSVTISENSNSFIESLQNVSNIMTLRISIGTLKVREYAFRSYMTWYHESIQSDHRMKQYQPNPFPINKGTMLVFIYSMRVQQKYAYSTVKNVFINELNTYIVENKLGGNPKKDFGSDLKNLLRALLRKYGNQIYKVEPLFNPDMKLIRSKLNLNVESDARTNAMMYFGRHGGNRGDSYEYMRLKHLEFKKISCSEDMNDFVITVYCTIV